MTGPITRQPTLLSVLRLSEKTRRPAKRHTTIAIPKMAGTELGCLREVGMLGLLDKGRPVSAKPVRAENFGEQPSPWGTASVSKVMWKRLVFFLAFFLGPGVLVGGGDLCLVHLFR